MDSKNKVNGKKKSPFSNKNDVRRLTYLAVLTAIVFVLQLVSFAMRGPVFSLTFVLVPIVVGISLCGKWAGPWLGFVFGVAVLVTGDANLFLSFSWFGTIVTVLLKGVLAGLAAAFVYNLLENKNRYLAVILAAITTPIVNTGTFFLGCVVFFLDDIQEFWQLEAGTTVGFVITGLIGINFIIELAVNVILVPTVCRLIEIAKKK